MRAGVAAAVCACSLRAGWAQRFSAPVKSMPAVSRVATISFAIIKVLPSAPRGRGRGCSVRSTHAREAFVIARSRVVDDVQHPYRTLVTYAREPLDALPPRARRWTKVH